MVICALIPRLALLAALGCERARLLAETCALAPEPGSALVGETSPAAEAAGVARGMLLGEALARCPELALVPPDPLVEEELWDGVLAGLEGIGAEVESEAPGLACFRADGMVHVHGGSIETTIDVARRAVAHPARFGAGPSRFVAVLAAQGATPRRPLILGEGEAGDLLATQPIGVLRLRPVTAELVSSLERLGLLTLGDVVELGRSRLADRFGRAGVTAWELAQGRDETPLLPRRWPERVEEVIDLPEAVSGGQLEYAVNLLVDRLLGRRERRDRRIRSLVLGARLVASAGTWRERVVLREPLGDAVRIQRVLGHRILRLPAPAETLSLAVEQFGPRGGEQGELFDGGSAQRRIRTSAGIRQARVVGGPEAILRVRSVQPDSHIAERRDVLTPYEP